MSNPRKVNATELGRTLQACLADVQKGREIEVTSRGTR